MSYFDYMNASSVLKEKGVLSELEKILHGISDIDHSKIKRVFLNKGWETEKNGFYRKQLGLGMRIRLKWLYR